MVTLPPAGWRRALKVVDVSLKKTTVRAAALTDGLHVGQRAVWTFLPQTHGIFADHVFFPPEDNATYGSSLHFTTQRCIQEAYLFGA